MCNQERKTGNIIISTTFISKFKYQTTKFQKKKGRKQREDLAGVSEAGVEVVFVDPVLQVANPESSDFFDGGRLCVRLS